MRNTHAPLLPQEVLIPEIWDVSHLRNSLGSGPHPSLETQEDGSDTGQWTTG